MKTATVLCEGVTLWALAGLLRARGLPLQRLLLYAWHPLPIWEFAGSGHVDAVAVACVTLALLAAARERPLLAGLALGGAALVKFLPVVVGPALYRRWDWRLPLAGAVTVVLFYLPYLDASGSVFGFLGGYSGEEGLRDGSGLYLWLLLKHVGPLPAAAFRFYYPAAATPARRPGACGGLPPRARAGRGRRPLARGTACGADLAPLPLVLHLADPAPVPRTLPRCPLSHGREHAGLQGWLATGLRRREPALRTLPRVVRSRPDEIPGAPRRRAARPDQWAGFARFTLMVAFASRGWSALPSQTGRRASSLSSMSFAWSA